MKSYYLSKNSNTKLDNRMWILNNSKEWNSCQFVPIVIQEYIRSRKFN